MEAKAAARWRRARQRSRSTGGWSKRWSQAGDAAARRRRLRSRSKQGGGGDRHGVRGSRTSTAISTRSPIEIGNGRETATRQLVGIAARAVDAPQDQGRRSRFSAASEYQAGERLRADFTRGQMMPRLGANWEASVASGRRARRRCRTDRRRACRAAAGRACDRRGRTRTVGHPDRRLLFSERDGNGGDRTRLAGSVGQGRAQGRARRTEPPLRSYVRQPGRGASTDAALGRQRLSSEPRLK